MRALLLSAAALLIAYCSQSRDKTFSSPLVFIENRGQITDQFLKSRDDIDFKIALNGVTVFIGAGHLHYQWSRATGKGIEDLLLKKSSKEFPIRTSPIEMYRMDVTFTGGNSEALLRAENESNYYERYYTGSATGEKAHSYGRITYTNLYPGIDWVLYVKDGVLKHEFIVNEGADAGLIRMKYSGASDLNILANGSLEARTPMGYITEQKPYSYQEGGKVISSRFVEKDETVSFELGSYSGKLVIDPTLEWGTYYGDAGFDVSISVKVDVFGDVYVGGVTEATSNMATTGSHQSIHGGDIRDAYLAKFSSSGQRVWATYYGGSELDAGYAVSCDPWGYVYLGGHTGSTNNISTSGSHQPLLFLNTSANAFLVKFDSSGVRMWSTYYGGLGHSFGAMGLACDAAGKCL
ncbi:MAG TPA: hypothetical protein VEB40_12380 [Flavipsychrobacter sp.]|nr:hypothetical protein [Flavipsychrobacter sp.]